MPHDDLDGIVERMLDGSEHSRRQFIRHVAGAGLLLGPGSAF
ncbi:MAG: twin-arginine translocation signal domain-containing protein, partial [Actinobacteria bacterium]